MCRFFIRRRPRVAARIRVVGGTQDGIRHAGLSKQLVRMRIARGVHGMVDRVTPEVRSRMMASIRSRDTQPELIVRRHLHRLGFRYRLAPRDLPGRPDLVMPKHGVAIFVHGCFWHGHAGCRFATVPATRTEFWTGKIAANRARDGAKEAQLMASGWRIAVVWECALRANRDAALQRLVAFIRSKHTVVEIAD